MTFREKIDRIVEESNLKIYQIEQKCGFGGGTIQKRYKLDKELTELYLKTFLEKMNISKNWWLTGEGDIFEDKFPQVNESQNNNYNVKHHTNAIEVDGDHAVVPVPVVEIKAQAGYLRGYSDTDYMEALPKIYVSPETVRGGNFIAFELSGDSMNDGSVRSFLHGDKILTRELYQKYWTDKIKSKKDKPFIIVHNDGILYKEIVHHDVANGIITCHSWNSSPEYRDFPIDLRDVKQIWYYIELVRRK